MPQDFYLRHYYAYEPKLPATSPNDAAPAELVIGEYVVGCLDTRYRTVYEGLRRIAATILKDDIILQLRYPLNAPIDRGYWLRAGHNDLDSPFLAPKTIAHLSDIKTPYRRPDEIFDIFKNHIKAMTFPTFGGAINLTQTKKHLQQSH